MTHDTEDVGVILAHTMKRKILEACLRKAIEYLPKHGEPYRHYTFVICKNKIIEWGLNRRGSPLTFLGYADHTKMHSEVDAYFKAKGLLDKQSFEVVNIRLNMDGSIKNSQPCSCCCEFLKNFKCNRVWFTTGMGRFARMDI